MDRSEQVDELRELELNPVTVLERCCGAVALDARIRIGDFGAVPPRCRLASAERRGSGEPR